MQKSKSTQKFISIFLAVMLVLSTVVIGVNATSNVKVAFTNNKGWSRVYVYAWDSNDNPIMGDWPGTRITDSAQNEMGETVFYTEIPANTAGLVFCEGANGQQTVDINFSGQPTGWYMTNKSGNTWQVATWNYNPDGQTQTDPPSGSKTVYFTNTLGWSNIKAHAWNSSQTPLLGSWPGTSVTWDSKNCQNQDIYKITLPESAVGLVFSNNGGAQTVDIVPADNTGYYPQSQNSNGKWNCGSWSPVKQIATTVAPTTVAPTTVAPTTVAPTTVAPTTVAPTTAEPTTIAGGSKTLYFKNTEGWSNAYAYGYDVNYDPVLGDWPGTAMTLAYTDSFGKDVYSITVPESAVGVCFTDNGDEETVDFVPQDGIGYYPETINSDGRWTLAQWNVSDADVTVAPTTAQPTTDVPEIKYYIALDSDAREVHVRSVDSENNYLLYYENMTLEQTDYYGKKIYSIVIPADAVKSYISFTSDSNGGLFVTPDLTAKETTYYYVTKYWDYTDCEIDTWTPGTAPWVNAEPTTSYVERKYYIALNPYAVDVKVIGMNRNGLIAIPFQDMTLEQTDYYGKNIYSVVLTEFTTVVNILFNYNSNTYMTPDLTADRTEYYYVTELLSSNECELGTWTPGNIPWEYEAPTEPPSVVSDGKIHFAINTEAYNVKMHAKKGGSTYASFNMTLDEENYHGMNVYIYDIPEDADSIVFTWYDAGNTYSSEEVSVEKMTYCYPAKSVGSYKWMIGGWAPGTAPWLEAEQSDPATDKKIYIAIDSNSSKVKIVGFDKNINAVFRYIGDVLTEKVFLESENYYGKKVYCVSFPESVTNFSLEWRSSGKYYYTSNNTPVENNIRYYYDGGSTGRVSLETWTEGTAPWAVYNPDVPVEPATEVKPTDVSVTGPQDSIYYAGDTFKPSSYSLSLKDNIAINFRVKPEAVEGYTNLCLMVSYNDSAEIINDYTTLSDGTLVFQFDKILPQSVGEAATAVLYGTKDGKNYYGDKYSKSVLDYADKYQVSGSSSLKGLLVNLLRYCAEAQKYTGNDVNNLVSDHIVPEAARYAKNTLDTMDDVKNYHAEACPNDAVSEFKSATLVLGSSVGIKVTFTAEELSGKSVRVDYNGESKYFDAESLTDEGNGRGSFIYNLYANQMHDTVRFTVCEGTTPISDTMTYSAASYAGKFIDNESVGPLLTQLMLYGQAAEYYSTNP